MSIVKFDKKVYKLVEYKFKKLCFEYEIEPDTVTMLNTEKMPLKVSLDKCYDEEMRKK